MPSWSPGSTAGTGSNLVDPYKPIMVKPLGTPHDKQPADLLSENAPLHHWVSGTLKPPAFNPTFNPDYRPLETPSQRPRRASDF